MTSDDIVALALAARAAARALVLTESRSPGHLATAEAREAASAAQRQLDDALDAVEAQS